MTGEEPVSVLDRQQLREVTLNNSELMREILDALIEDSSRQTPQIEAAIRAQDSPRIMRLAHYSKGACANVGARAAASVLEDIERCARRGEYRQCDASLAALGRELDRLRDAAATI
ncbi:MAG: Hpt domain-containing protein [Planctomycetota bacterium]|nr:MAG: Hpt domain-containing protein [Planctomycetota bacterium]